MRMQPKSDESLEALLREMLNRLRRSRDTPLRFSIDSLGIAGAAVRISSTGAAPDWSGLESVLDRMVQSVFRDELEDVPPEEPRARGESSGAGGKAGGEVPPETGGGNGAGGPQALAAWLDRLHSVLVEVHPAAVEIAWLRTEGYADREIARRLGLGLRLLRRVIRCARSAWEKAMPCR